MATLRIEVKGQTFEAPLPDQAVRIGSADDADLKLNVGAIGGTHCELEPLGNDRYRLRDSGSGYQTKVNGNGVHGHDETSEWLDTTFILEAPTPNLP